MLSVRGAAGHKRFSARMTTSSASHLGAPDIVFNGRNIAELVSLTENQMSSIRLITDSTHHAASLFVPRCGSAPARSAPAGLPEGGSVGSGRLDLVPRRLDLVSRRLNLLSGRLNLLSGRLNLVRAG